MNIVVHVCCAPCLASTLDTFAELGRVSAYFHNPNIHPLLEFRKRLKALEVFAERRGVDLEADRQYGLHRFLRLVPPDGTGRCGLCYRERLGRTARHAAETGADAFSTTMLCSAHQDHQAIRQAGEEAAAESGVEFIYRDLRDRADEGHAAARKMSLYRQQYCGCVFSEYERYKDTNVEIRRATHPT
jgi:predicted adenine nucleotide alpha hydrolase (AANH) superfamily ATPase